MGIYPAFFLLKPQLNERVCVHRYKAQNISRSRNISAFALFSEYQVQDMLLWCHFGELHCNVDRLMGDQLPIFALLSHGLYIVHSHWI